MSIELSPSAIVDAQYDAYNRQDVDGMCSFYASDCVFTDLNGKVVFENRAAFRDQFIKTFAEFPQNRATSASRMTLGSLVVDHELTFRTPNSAPIQSVALYTVREGVIVRLAMGGVD